MRKFYFIFLIVMVILSLGCVGQKASLHKGELEVEEKYINKSLGITDIVEPEFPAFRLIVLNEKDNGFFFFYRKPRGVPTRLPTNISMYRLTESIHYFKLRNTYNYAEEVEHSTAESDDWDVKVEIEDKVDLWLFRVTYHKTLQNENTIRQRISEFKNKNLVELQLSSKLDPDCHMEDFDLFEVGVEIHQKEISLNEYTRTCSYVNVGIEREITNNKSFSIDSDKIKEGLLDSLVSFDYSNEAYVEEKKAFLAVQQLALEDEVTEKIVMRFGDDKLIEVSYYSYGGELLGEITIDEEQYLFSKYSEGQVFYHSIKKVLGNSER